MLKLTNKENKLLIFVFIGFLILIPFPTKALETLTLNPTDDTWIDEAAPEDNKGNSGVLWVRSGKENLRKSFIKFDLSLIPEDTTIISAKLRLFNHLGPSEDSGPTENVVVEILEEWTENEVTWNNQPDVSQTITDTQEISDGPSGWIEWDVKSDVVKNQQKNYESYGWLIDDMVGQSIPSTRYRAKESGNVDERPHLVVVHTNKEFSEDDIVLLLNSWGDCNEERSCPFDFNEDKVVDIFDLEILMKILDINFNPELFLINSPDINGDQKVDGLDLAILLSQWGECKDFENCPADLYGDEAVDNLDLKIILGFWGEYIKR